MLKRAFLLAAALIMPLAAAQAVPADTAAAVSAPGRPDAAVALDAGRKPAEVLAFGGLQRGAYALDLFTGSGYFAEIMGRAVGPNGRVLAWEPANFLNERSTTGLNEIRTRTPNVSWFAAPADALALPANAFDFVMLNLNYHDTYWESARFRFPRMDPDAFLRNVFQSLKPGGTILVIDHVANAGGETRAVVEAVHRIDPATVRADFERAGFVFDGASDVLRNPGRRSYQGRVRSGDPREYRPLRLSLPAAAPLGEEGPARVAPGPFRRDARHFAERAGHMGLVGEALLGGVGGEAGLARHLLEGLLEAEQPQVAARRQADMSREPALQRARAHSRGQAHLRDRACSEDRPAGGGERRLGGDLERPGDKPSTGRAAPPAGCRSPNARPMARAAALRSGRRR